MLVGQSRTSRGPPVATSRRATSSEIKTAEMRTTAKIMRGPYGAGPSIAWSSVISRGRRPAGLAERRRPIARGPQGLAGSAAVGKTASSHGAGSVATAVTEAKEGGVRGLAAGRPVRTIRGRGEVLGKGSATSSSGCKREDAGPAVGGGRRAGASADCLPFEVSFSVAQGRTAISSQLFKVVVCEILGRSVRPEIIIMARVRVLGSLVHGLEGKVPVCPVASKPIMPVCRS